MIKNCKICDEEFESKYKHALYCSKYCQGQSKKKPRICVGCGATFLSKSKQQQYCSITCGQLSISRDSRVELTCAKCGILFTRTKSRIRHDITYCSRDCSDGTLKPSARTSKLVDCDNCSKSFLRQPNAINPEYNYCSHECYSEHIMAEGRRKGANNPRYNAEITQDERIRKRNYPEYVEWRKGVYERDNYTCQCCLQRGRTLHAHHIYNYATHKELRTNITNGVTMCEHCHRGFHAMFGNVGNNREQLNEFIRKIS